MRDPLVERCRAMIRDGSKSFAAAARLFDPATRDAAYLLYAWCRYCDDAIDGETLGFREAGSLADKAAQRDRLERLRAATHRALEGGEAVDPVFEALRRVVRQHAIPHVYPLELLEGFAMDVEGRRYETLHDVFAYCYHVAGVVGLMMSHVMGVREAAARRTWGSRCSSRTSPATWSRTRGSGGCTCLCPGCASPASRRRSWPFPGTARGSPASWAACSPRRSSTMPPPTSASSACGSARHGPSRWRAASTRTSGAWCSPAGPGPGTRAARCPGPQGILDRARSRHRGGRRHARPAAAAPAAPGAVVARRLPRRDGVLIDAGAQRTTGSVYGLPGADPTAPLGQALGVGGVVDPEAAGGALDERPDRAAPASPRGGSPPGPRWRASPRRSRSGPARSASRASRPPSPSPRPRRSS